MRHKPLNVPSGTFHSRYTTLEPDFPYALFAPATRVVIKKCCHLVDIFCNYNLAEGVYWHLQFTRGGGRGWGGALGRCC